MKVYGGWSCWSGWSTCGSNCMKSRARSCTNPIPSNGGSSCSGPDTSHFPCTGGDCPKVDGQWSQWTCWSPCDNDCLKSRNRTCTNPSPSGGGAGCQGYDKYFKKCRNCEGTSKSCSFSIVIQKH